MNKIEKERQSFTKKTKKKSTKNVEKNTNWTRKCPICDTLLKYSYKQSYDYAVKLNKQCRKCIPKKFGKFNPNYKGIMDKSLYHKNCPNCGKSITYTSYETYRKAVRHNRGCGCIKKNSWACYNPVACKLFNEINKELGWNGQHAQNGGEKRVSKYWVDYYEPNLNLVIEYDEGWHKYTKKYDKKRQTEIQQYLSCKFYRIKEGQNWREVINETI